MKITLNVNGKPAMVNADDPPFGRILAAIDGSATPSGWKESGETMSHMRSAARALDGGTR